MSELASQELHRQLLLATEGRVPAQCVPDPALVRLRRQRGRLMQRQRGRDRRARRQARAAEPLPGSEGHTEVDQPPPQWQ